MAENISDDIRDGWECDGGCGCGICIGKGIVPDPPFHMVSDGAGGEKVCGRFVFAGPCKACLEDEARSCLDREISSRMAEQIERDFLAYN